MRFGIIYLFTRALIVGTHLHRFQKKKGRQPYTIFFLFNLFDTYWTRYLIVSISICLQSHPLYICYTLNMLLWTYVLRRIIQISICINHNKS